MLWHATKVISNHNNALSISPHNMAGAQTFASCWKWMICYSINYELFQYLFLFRVYAYPWIWKITRILKHEDRDFALAGKNFWYFAKIWCFHLDSSNTPYLALQAENYGMVKVLWHLSCKLSIEFCLYVDCFCPALDFVVHKYLFSPSSTPSSYKVAWCCYWWDWHCHYLE